MLRDLLSFLFGIGRRSRNDGIGVTRRRTSSAADSQEDILKGWEFCATLSPETPLEVLERHGKVHPGPREALPEYGDQSEGIWMPKTKTFQEMGIDLPEFPESSMASQVGSVPADGGDFLPFLKDFRRVVEGPEPVPEQIETLRELKRKDPKYRDFMERLGDDFPRRFFVEKLTVVDGIGMSTAWKLFRGGFYSIDHLCEAAASELKNVSGVGAATVQEIQEYCTS